MQHYRLENLDCPNCANKLECALKADSTIRNARINFAQGTLAIDCADISYAQKLIESIEPDVRLSPIHHIINSNTTANPASPLTDAHTSKMLLSQRLRHFLTKELIWLLALIAAFLASLVCEYAYISSLSDTQTKARWEMFLYGVHIALYIAGVRVIFTRSIRTLKRGELFDENTLMLMVSIAAFAIGASEEAVGIVLFFSVGEYLQNISVQKGRETIGALSTLTPKIAHKLHSHNALESTLESAVSLDSSKATLTQDIPAQSVAEKDIILVYAGEMVPVDAILLEERAVFDYSALSGESLPVTKSKGDEILSGAIAIDKALRLEALRPYEKSQIAIITELIESATSSKARTELFITQFARYYTPIVLVIAFIVALVPPLVGLGGFSEWIYRALVVLMVSCPCALVISVPLGYFGGITACAKEHILIKGANYLEALSSITTLGFDKTGTLTRGKFGITRIVPESNVSEQELLGYASCAQDLSHHPIATSIKHAYAKYAHNHNISEFQEFSGLGVRSVCHSREVIVGNDKILHKFAIPHSCLDTQGTTIHISVDKRYLGYLVINDELKADAFMLIQELKNMRITPFMLSGDNDASCKRVAQELEIDYRSELLPQEKAQYIQELKQRDARGRVGFVGDGINDAPTLALCDVGIAMGSASDLSSQNADIIVLNNSLASLLQACKIAKKTKTIIYQNIALALGVKGVFIMLGVFGVVSIWEAVFSDVGVALLALANAMRTMKIPHTKTLQNPLKSYRHSV